MLGKNETELRKELRLINGGKAPNRIIRLIRQHTLNRQLAILKPLYKEASSKMYPNGIEESILNAMEALKKEGAK